MTTQRMIDVLAGHIEAEKEWNIEENKELIEALTCAVDILRSKKTTIPLEDGLRLDIHPCFEVCLCDEKGIVRYETDYGEYEPLVCISADKEKSEKEGRDLLDFYNSIKENEQ